MGNEKQERNRNIIIGILIGLVIGIMVGMFIQQIVMIKGIEKAGEGWEGVISNMDITVDINETKLVEGVNETFHNLYESGYKVKGIS